MSLSSKKSEKIEINNIFTTMLINQTINVECKNVDNNLSTTLLNIVKNNISGKCINEGYVKPDTISIVNYSNGIVKSNIIEFLVTIECSICNLVEGSEIECVAKNITKAGIRAELNMDINPVTIFVARDHHYINHLFNKVDENDYIIVKIIGQRFELNDTNICCIAELISISKKSTNSKSSSNASSSNKSVIKDNLQNLPLQSSINTPSLSEKKLETNESDTLDNKEEVVEKKQDNLAGKEHKKRGRPKKIK